jgi:hypothetical protein
VAYGGWTGAEPVRVCQSDSAVVKDGSLVPQRRAEMAAAALR